MLCLLWSSCPRTVRPFLACGPRVGGHTPSAPASDTGHSCTDASDTLSTSLPTMLPAGCRGPAAAEGGEAHPRGKGAAHQSLLRQSRHRARLQDMGPEMAEALGGGGGRSARGRDRGQQYSGRLAAVVAHAAWRSSTLSHHTPGAPAHAPGITWYVHAGAGGSGQRH